MITVVATCLVATAAIFAIGYYTGRDTASSETDRLKQEIELYKAAQNTKNVLTFLEDLRDYNENLFKFEKHAGKVAELNRKIKELTEESAKLSAIIAVQSSETLKLKEALGTKESEIKQLTKKLSLKYTVAEEVLIPEGQAHTFLNGYVTLGVKSLFSNWTSVTIFDRNEHLDVGEGYRFKIENNICAVIFNGVAKKADSKYAKFSFVCEDKG